MIPVLLIVSFVLLLVFPTAAFDGAKNGLLLWFQIVVPTLFPFLILTALCVKLKVTDFLSLLFSGFITRTLHLSPACAYPLITGILSGYPVGAKAVSAIWEERKITRAEGNFLLGFCNNVSPVFFLNFVCIRALGCKSDRFFLLFILWISALASAFFIKPKGKQENLSVGRLSLSKKSKGSAPSVRMDDIIMNTAELLVKVGGYIILFSLLANIFNVYVYAPPAIKAFLGGFLEITTGIHLLSQAAALPVSSRLLLGMVICSFGGLCALFQTQAVLSGTPFSMKSYLFSKVRGALICFVLTLIYIKIRGY